MRRFCLQPHIVVAKPLLRTSWWTLSLVRHVLQYVFTFMLIIAFCSHRTSTLEVSKRWIELSDNRFLFSRFFRFFHKFGSTIRQRSSAICSSSCVWYQQMMQKASLSRIVGKYHHVLRYNEFLSDIWSAVEPYNLP